MYIFISVCMKTLLLLFAFLGIAIGGDVFPGSTLSDHVLRYQNIPQVCLAILYVDRNTILSLLYFLSILF